MKKVSGLHAHTGYWLRRLSDVANSQLVDKLNQADVSWAEWGVLVTLYRKEANSPAAIADHIGIDRAAVTRVVERLVRRKFVERQKAADRRKTILKLTEAAQKKVPELAKVVDQNEADFFDALSENEKKAFIKAVSRLLKGRGIQPSTEWESKCK